MPVDEVVDLLAHGLLLRRNRRLERAQPEAQRDDALLCAVVEVAFDSRRAWSAAATTRARDARNSARVSALRDGGGDQIGEIAYPRLGFTGHRGRLSRSR